MKTISLFLLIVYLLLMVPGVTVADTPGPPMESTHYAVAWSVLETAHGGQAASDNFKMDTVVVGQMIAQSTSSDDHYALCTGYACLPTTGEYRIFLPLILRL